jgi:hypothetical protein
MRDLSQRFATLGEELVRCTEACSGITLEPQRGIVPRCLIFEVVSRTDSAGCAVVGLNPGHAPERERQYYVQHGLTYDSLVSYWSAHGKSHRYAVLLRRFLDAAELTGPILWTELAKCESSGTTLPPLQTFRCCVTKFLERELSILPKDWPLIGVGRASFNALAFRFGSRPVIGVPHPTGSYGHFGRLFGKDGLRTVVATEVRAALGGAGAVWLDGAA